MRAVIGVLTSRWFLTLIGTALLCGVVWLFGPLLPALEDWPARLGVVLAMLAVWAGGEPRCSTCGAARATPRWRAGSRRIGRPRERPRKRRPCATS